MRQPFAALAGLDKAYAVNIKGTAMVTKHFSRLMKSQARGGAIVNISSISSLIAQPGFVPYSMTKAAIAQMTRNTALDLGQYNIRCGPSARPQFLLMYRGCMCPGCPQSPVTGLSPSVTWHSSIQVIGHRACCDVLSYACSCLQARSTSESQ